MTFWIILVALTALAVAGLVLPLVHAGIFGDNEPDGQSVARPLGARFRIALAIACVVVFGAASLYAALGRPDLTDWENASALGDSLVRAAGGVVTPDALAAFHRALDKNPTDPRARFYVGLYENQHGRHSQAIADWIALVKSSAPGAPWVGPVRMLIERVARQNRIDVSREFSRGR